MKRLSTSLLALALLACEAPWQTASGGSATETTGGAKVTGLVVYPDGSGAAGARVLVRSAEWPSDSGVAGGTALQAQAVTGADGRYKIDSLASGDYWFEVRDAKGNLAMAAFRKDGERGNQARGSDTLRAPGAVIGSLSAIRGTADTGLVELFGLGRTARADSNGDFRFGDLPAGEVQVRALSSRANYKYVDTVAVVVPAVTVTMAPFTAVVDEDYATWAHKEKVLIQTDLAGVDQDVQDFPLALRLFGGLLDFTQTDGKDLRFADALGKPLPYMIESWDTKNASALVWVHLDNVKGNAKQYITLYWGKPGAPDMADPKAVFATFAGAWHLSDSLASDGWGTFRDASPSAADGMGQTLPQFNQGLLGGGQGFDKRQAIIVPPEKSPRPTAGLCVSAWVRMDGMDSLGAEIASLGGSWGLRAGTDGIIRFYMEHTGGITELSADSLGLADGKWHLITGTYDGTAMRVFLDGKEKTFAQPSKAMAYTHGGEFRLGTQGEGKPGYGFKGSLDEIQVTPKVRSPAWIKMQFENQRVGTNTLVVYAI